MQTISSTLPVAVRSRAKYTPEEEAALLREHRETGLSVRDFCEQRGINRGTFYALRMRHREREKADKAPFLNVVRPAGGSYVTLILHGGHELRFHPTLTGAVVRSLEQPDCGV